METPVIDEQTRRRAIRRNVLWLVAAACGVYVSYIVYIFVWSQSA